MGSSKILQTAHSYILGHLHTYTLALTHIPTPRDSQKKVYPIGSLVSVLCGNSVGQVMEQGVMMHQQHQPWVAPPAEVADGTHDWRAATHSHKHTPHAPINTTSHTHASTNMTSTNKHVRSWAHTCKDYKKLTSRNYNGIVYMCFQEMHLSLQKMKEAVVPST